jgi:hypothetical protein
MSAKTTANILLKAAKNPKNDPRVQFAPECTVRACDRNVAKLKANDKAQWCGVGGREPALWGVCYISLPAFKSWASLLVPGAGVTAPSPPTGGVVVVPFAFLLPCLLLRAFFPGAGVTTTSPRNGGVAVVPFAFHLLVIV